MEVTTTVTKYLDEEGAATGKYRFKHSFEWLTDPVWTLTDVIGITHQDYFSYEQDSEYFRYTYDIYYADNYYDTKYVREYSADKKDVDGLAFDFDLLASDNTFEVRNNRGYMYYTAYLSNSDYGRGNVYGHYTHTEVAIGTLAINLITGHMTVSGAVSQTQMTDTGVSFSTE